jgi:hypothetical protein
MDDQNTNPAVDPMNDEGAVDETAEMPADESVVSDEDEAEESAE